MLRKLLKVYFWLICLIILAVTFFNFDDGIPLDLLDYIDWVFTLITLSGVFSYCYLKPLLTAKFWRIFLPVLIIWDAFFVSTAFIDAPVSLTQELGIATLIVWIVLLICLLLPSYIALYLLPREFETKDSFEMEA